MYKDPDSEEYGRCTLRIPRELLDKMAYIAAQNGRSLNRETQGLIARHVEEFEEERGPIPPRP